MRSPAARTFLCVSVACALAASLLPVSHAQDVVVDLRALHQLAVFATVRIEGRGVTGTGWMLEQNGPRPIVITNRHVVEGTGPRIRVSHYLASDGTSQETAATVQWTSDAIDLAIVRLDADPPASARALTLETGDVIRGERIIVAGQPNGLPFQTTEGVVTGQLPETSFSRRCGEGRNCVVVDAASFAGSSGGPALNTQGRLVGMLWANDSGQAASGLPIYMRIPTFAFLIHVRTIAGELRAYGTRIREQRERRQ